MKNYAQVCVMVPVCVPIVFMSYPMICVLIEEPEADVGIQMVFIYAQPPFVNSRVRYTAQCTVHADKEMYKYPHNCSEVV